MNPLRVQLAMSLSTVLNQNQRLWATSIHAIAIIFGPYSTSDLGEGKN